MTLELSKTPDILAELGKDKKTGLMVGFAAESENVIENASRKLKEKKLDLIIANDITLEGAGFDSDSNKVYILTADGIVEETSLVSKDAIAKIIIDTVSKSLN